jgi:hypothetical protein
MFPFSLLPLVLSILFLFIWGFIVWMKFREHVHLVRHHEQEARSHIVSVRKLGPPRRHAEVEYEAG